MSSEQLYEVHQSVQMLLSAFSDVEQTLENFSNIDIESEQECNCTTGAQKWLKPSENMPGSDSDKVIVHTKDGQIYFLSTIAGRFPKNVDLWLPLPALPN